jgi:hypothetical protein
MYPAIRPLRQIGYGDDRDTPRTPMSRLSSESPHGRHYSVDMPLAPLPPNPLLEARKREREYEKERRLDHLEDQLRRAQTEIERHKYETLDRDRMHSMDRDRMQPMDRDRMQSMDRDRMQSMDRDRMQYLRMNSDRGMDYGRLSGYPPPWR